MEFQDVIRRRRMVRTYDPRPVPRVLLDRVVDAGLRAPSAGYSQGWAHVVLEGPSQTAPFWSVVNTTETPPKPGGRFDRLRAAPVVIVPLAHKAAYLERYSEPDKADYGLDDEQRWPVPFWDIDVAFGTMAMLLAAVDLGLGALFFGIFDGEQALLDLLGVPAGYRPIGAVTLGYPAAEDSPSPSLARGRRPREQVVHYGRW